MMSTRQLGTVVVVLLVAVAVVFVLMTPDPTDNVDAILHTGKSLHVPALHLASVLIVGLTTLVTRHSSPIAITKAKQDSLELLCSCRC